MALAVLLFNVSVNVSAQFGPDAASNPDTLDSIVAVVEDDVVTRRELDQAVALVRNQLINSRGRDRLPPPEVIERQVLERLILEQLQQRIARERGISIDDAALNAATEQIARRNNMSLDQLRRTVEREGGDYRRYREQLRRELLANRLRQREVDSRIQVSEQEVTNVLENSANARDYRIAQILIAIPEGASPQAVDQARARAEQVLAELRNGADFASLAAAVSAGREALEGGDLGWRARNQLPSLFAETVLRLRPGQVSAPVRSPAGFHLIKLLDTRSARAAADDEQTREAIRQQLFRRKSEEEWELWLRQLRDESYVEIRLRPA